MELGRSDELTLNSLESRPKSSFRFAKRIDFRNINPDEFFSTVEDHVCKQGLPLVIGNATLSWRRDRQNFGFDWLKQNCGSQTIRARREDIRLDPVELTVHEFLHYLNQPTAEILQEGEAQCPPLWKDLIAQKLPQFCCQNSDDLVKELPAPMRPESIQMRIGGRDGKTPTGCDPLGSLGHNLMVYSDEGAATYWFVFARSDRDAANAFWKAYGGSVTSENVFVPMEDLTLTPFPVHVIEQKEGDLVLVPSEAAYQTLNKFGNSVKVSWCTVDYHSILNSYFSAIPLYRSLGRSELFRIKTIAYLGLLKRVKASEDGPLPDVVATATEYPSLLTILEDCIAAEKIDPKVVAAESGKNTVAVARISDPFPHFRMCNFCKCSLWNRFYHCAKCFPSADAYPTDPFSANSAPTKPDGYDICLACFAEGRGCAHKEDIKLTEYVPADVVEDQFAKAKQTFTKVYQSAKRKKVKKRPLQEWKPKKTSDKERSVGTVAYTLAQMYSKENVSDTCHQCEKLTPYIQNIYVTCCKKSCQNVYCARCIWNRYGEKLLDCLKKKWTCPSCRNICNCPKCLEKAGQASQELSPEKILGATLEASYPFASMPQPNVPGISDSKPQFVLHNLKKRKMGGIYSIGSISITTTTPTPTPFSSPVVAPPTPSPRKFPSDVDMRDSNGPGLATPTKLSSSDPFTVESEVLRSPLATSLGASGERLMSPTSAPSTPNLDSERWTVLVRNLSYQSTYDDVYKLLIQCGEIENLTTPLDKVTGKIRGYGFVRYARKQDAEEAIRRLSFTPFMDRTIELEWSLHNEKLGGPSKRPFEPMRNVICFKCGSAGHFARDCPVLVTPKSEGELDRDQPSRSDSRGFRTCYVCNKEGHIAAECPNRASQSITSPTSRQGVLITSYKNVESRGDSRDLRDSQGDYDRYSRRDDSGSDDRDDEPKRRKYSGWDVVPERRDRDLDNRDSRDYDRDRERDSRDNDRDYGSRYNGNGNGRGSGKFGSPEPERSRRSYSQEGRNGFSDYGSSGNTPNFSASRDPRDPRYTTQNGQGMATGYSYSSPTGVASTTYNGISPVPSQSPTVQTSASYSAGYANGVAPPQFVGSAPYSNGSRGGTPTSVAPFPFNNLGAVISQSMQFSGQPLTTPPPNFSSPSVPQPAPSKVDPEKKKQFKNHVTNLVVKQLSKYFNSRQIDSKEDFKQLSKKIATELIERDPSCTMDKETDSRIKKYVDGSFQQFQASKTRY
eukprot:TRINITY_DN3837_c0_g1_i4.p1 TRINITY_DN3837_c0_g1~~TRINITY_DN3837_c0_g1_i4.p1  ORF type:complete len:1236 (-),score=280.64 TRINITY_DN3837_c0_g1_i4:49-3756(-)